MNAPAWTRRAKQLLGLGPKEFRSSYSQRGEDLIIEDLFRILGIEHPVYLDIGANHPIRFSNSYLFYKKGGSGICVEPNPALAQVIHAARPRDLCLNIGISAMESPDLKFFVFDNDSLSTFSPEQAERLERETEFRRIRTEMVPMMTVNQVMARHPQAKAVNFISLDCEGLDISILEKVDFRTTTPEILCVETIGCVDSTETHIRRTVKEILQARSYLPVADTQINTIFAHETSLERLKISALAY